MTPEAQRIAIAEACGWKAHVDGLGYYQGVHPALMGGRAIPDYLNDLNAMHKAEQVMTPAQCVIYAERLSSFKCMHVEQPIEGPQSFMWGATAAQRAEAFLRTLGKWEGAK